MRVDGEEDIRGAIATVQSKARHAVIWSMTHVRRSDQEIEDVLTGLEDNDDRVGMVRMIDALRLH